jgi:outer membrane protein assembly factor BamB
MNVRLLAAGWRGPTHDASRLTETVKESRNGNAPAARASIIGLAVLIVLAYAAIGTGNPPVSWPQWGGPNRNFMVETQGLAEKWPDGGPKRLWTRELGDGYSTIVADDGRLYTMYRVKEVEFVVALDAQTGKTAWEIKYASPFTDLMNEFGPGPHSTPLVVGDRLFTVGVNMVFHCLDKNSGEVLWKRDLMAEFGAVPPDRGYSASPLAFKDTIILPVGAKEGEPKGQSVVAFRQSDGEVVWKSQDFQITHSSPILIRFDGKDQLVVFMGAELAGLNPDSGELLWSHPHNTQYGANLSTPLWTGDDLIFASAAYDSGSRVIRLTKEGDRVVPQELWYHRKMRIHHGNAVRVGDTVYGSSGDFGPALFVAADIKTGNIAWRERGLAKATCLYADGKFIILDEDGQLVLATPTAEGLRIHSKCEVAKRTSWAAPTLVGKTLYVRDRKTIAAYDLGAS